MLTVPGHRTHHRPGRNAGKLGTNARRAGRQEGRGSNGTRRPGPREKGAGRPAEGTRPASPGQGPHDYLRGPLLPRAVQLSPASGSAYGSWKLAERENYQPAAGREPPKGGAEAERRRGPGAITWPGPPHVTRAASRDPTPPGAPGFPGLAAFLPGVMPMSCWAPGPSARNFSRSRLADQAQPPGSAESRGGAQ